MKLLHKLFNAPVKAFCITHVLGPAATALRGPFTELRCVAWIYMPVWQPHACLFMALIGRINNMLATSPAKMPSLS